MEVDASARPDFWYILNQMTSIKDNPKKRGRPATGRDPLVGVRLPPEMIEAVDAWAKERGTTRAGAIRSMIERALAG